MAAKTLTDPLETAQVPEDGLVRLWQAGDAQAQARLYEVFFPLLVARLRRQGVDHVAEDLAQDAWCRATRSVQRFDSTKPLWPWLKTIADNTCKNYFRGTQTADRRPRMASLDASEAGPLLVAPDHADAVVVRTAMRDALALLPPNQRGALAARFVGDLSYAEAAALLGAKEPATRKLVERGLKALRLLVADVRLAVMAFLPRRHWTSLRDRLDRLGLAASPMLAPTLTATVQVGLVAVLVGPLPAAAEALEPGSHDAAAVVVTFENGRPAPAAPSAKQPSEPARGETDGDRSARQVAKPARDGESAPSRGDGPEFDPVAVPGTARTISSDRDPDKDYVDYGVAVSVPGEEPLTVGVAAHDEEPGAEAHQHACEVAGDGEPFTYCTPP